MDLRRATTVTAAVALAIGCGGHPRPPSVIASRLVPSVVLGGFEHDTMVKIAPVHASLHEAPPEPIEPKTEPTLPREVLQQPRTPGASRARLPDEVVMRLLESGRAVFVRCFKKAYEADATVVSFKVHVYVETDATGVLTSARADTPNAVLATCLTRAAGYLRFPASDGPVAVDLPLIYQIQ